MLCCPQMLPSGNLKPSAPASKQFRGSIAGPTNSLCTLHVQDCSCPRNTRFRLSAHLAGRAWVPVGFQRRFQHSIHSPSPGLAWRTKLVLMWRQVFTGRLVRVLALVPAAVVLVICLGLGLVWPGAAS